MSNLPNQRFEAKFKDGTVFDFRIHDNLISRYNGNQLEEVIDISLVDRMDSALKQKIFVTFKVLEECC